MQRTAGCDIILPINNPKAISAGPCAGPASLLIERKGDLMKLLVKVLAVLAALAAAVVAIALLLEKEQRPDYISIYDHDEDEIPF